MSDWNSGQYIKFERERTQPSLDLIARLDISPKSILDIGCGPGNSTVSLRRNFPAAELLGVDASDNMLEKAKSTYPNLNFQSCRIPDELDRLGKYDLIFSNACLHWIPSHRDLFPKISEKLNDGGMLAVQMPSVQKAVFYKTLNATVSHEKWKKLSEIKIFHNLSGEEYYDILTSAGCEVTLWETTYYHRVSSHEDVISWYKGSGLRPYLEALAAGERESFLRELTDAVRDAFAPCSDGSILLKMPRLFLIATKC